MRRIIVSYVVFGCLLLVLAQAFYSGNHITGSFTGAITGAQAIHTVEENTSEARVITHYIDYNASADIGDLIESGTPLSGVSAEEAKAALDQAQDDLKEMQRLNLPTAYIRDALLIAMRAYEGANLTALREKIDYLNRTYQEDLALSLYHSLERAQRGGYKVGTNYSLVVDKAKDIRRRKEHAIELYDRIRLFSLRLAEVDPTIGGVNFSSILDTFDTLERQYALGQFTGLSEQIVVLNQELDQKLIEQATFQVYLKASQRTFFNWVRANLLLFCLLVVLFVIITLLGVNEGYLWWIQHRVRYLKKEKEVLFELLKEAQHKHYIEGTLSRTMYQTRTKHYKEKILEIKHTLPILDADVRERRHYRHPLRIFALYWHKLHPTQKKKKK